MLFKLCKKEGSLACRITIAAIAWLIFISILHYWLNIRTDNRQQFLLGYMPVVSNLAAPLLDYASKDGDGIRFKGIKFASFAEMAEALRNDKIQAAFIIAPLAIVLRQQGSDIKVVYIGNRHESTLVAQKSLQIKSINDLVGHTVAVPMRYSAHNLTLLNELAKKGLGGQVKIVEMNPPDMAAALATGRLDAYFVGEPFAANTLQSGDASVVFYGEDIWPDFICNLVIVKKTLIDSDTRAVETLVRGAVRSGFWAVGDKDAAASIVAAYWNQLDSVIKYALSTPSDRLVIDRYLPKEAELQELADLMVLYKLSDSNDITGLIDASFASRVQRDNITTINSILAAPK